MSESAIHANKEIVQAESQLHIDQTWSGVYRAGGIALLLSGLIYLFNISLSFMLGGTPPGDSEAFLQSIASKPVIAQMAYWLYGLVDILLMIGVLGLYLSLKEIGKNAMLIAAGLVCFFAVLDLGITELNTLALVRLTQDYAAATGEAQRAAFLGAAHWGLATLPIATFFSWVGPSSGFLIASIVMLKGIYGKGLAWLGIMVYGLAMIAGFYFLIPVPFLNLLLTPILLLYGVWLMMVGRRLYRLAQPLALSRS